MNILFAIVAVASAGRVTFYTPMPWHHGACGWALKDPTHLGWCAIGPSDGGKSWQSPKCGQKIYGWNNRGKFECTVADECPECERGHLDLTLGAFLQVCTKQEGVCDIYWQWEGLNRTEPVKSSLSLGKRNATTVIV